MAHASAPGPEPGSAEHSFCTSHNSSYSNLYDDKGERCTSCVRLIGRHQRLFGRARRAGKHRLIGLFGVTLVSSFAKAYLLCKQCCRQGSVNASLCAAAAYNWCTVEESSYDVILFPAIAVVLACLFQGRYSTTLVLLAGALSTPWCPRRKALPFLQATRSVLFADIAKGELL